MRVGFKAPVAFTFDELRRLLVKTSEVDHRSYVMFLVMCCHGLRVSEAVSRRRWHFSTSKGVTYLTTKRLKGGLETVQQLLSSTDPLFDEASVVTEFIENLKPGGFLFTNYNGEALHRAGVNWLLDKYALAADIPAHKSHPHTLRHTCGVLMRRAGCRLEEIQDTLGHVSLDSTRQYLQMTAEEVDAARVSAFTRVINGELPPPQAQPVPVPVPLVAAAAAPGGRTLFEHPATIYER